MEELLKKEFPYLNPLMLEEIFMKMESRGVINVFRVSKNKKMIVFNKDNQMIRNKIKKQLS